MGIYNTREEKYSINDFSRSKFGIEVHNGGTEKFRNELARQFACHYKLAMTSGSDIDTMDRLAKGGIITNVKIDTSEDFIAVLKNGAYSLIENY